MAFFYSDRFTDGLATRMTIFSSIGYFAGHKVNDHWRNVWLILIDELPLVIFHLKRIVHASCTTIGDVRFLEHAMAGHHATQPLKASTDEIFVGLHGRWIPSDDRRE